MKHRRLTAGAVMVAAVILTATAAFAFPGQKQYGAQAKISIAKARAIALKSVPGGKIVGEELEKEAGGSGLRYSFDVKIDGKTREVGVDAKTAKVLENSLEGADSD